MTDATNGSALAERLVEARRSGLGRFDAALVPADAAAGDARAARRRAAHRRADRRLEGGVRCRRRALRRAALCAGHRALAGDAPARLGDHVLVEIETRLPARARDLPARETPREEIVAALDQAIVGIELIRGRLGEPPAVPFLGVPRRQRGQRPAT
ncbi:MAG: hypothetical protein MZW92_32270 [Comamonadaceae bacterium]|nr:hypothetical protein [Comamonadaceae bacterium]